MAVQHSKLAILHEHYHVTDAGVRMVLDSLIQGIVKNWPEPATQFLWYSPQKFQDRTTPCEKYSDRNLALIEDKQLGYLSTPFSSIEHFEDAVQKRKKAKLDFINHLFTQHETMVHIIQNPTLLKNPVETQSNSLMAQDLLEKNYIQIWYIHDLLEESSARQKLRNHIKRIAGKNTEKVYGVNAAGIAWQKSPNIFYITINKMAHEALKRFLRDGSGTCISYLPNPVDVEALRITPSFKENGLTLDESLEVFCSHHQQDGYTFNPCADIIIAAEVARERKNTGEQLLILNMLNRTLKNVGKQFQLLVTLLPDQGADNKRIIKFQEYIRVNHLPVVMGFGKEIIGRGYDRTPGLFAITDLWSHPRAYMGISTAVKEGFGLNFINPAVATMDNPYTLTTVGRKVKEVWPDLMAAGMVMPDDAFYDAVTIDAALFPAALKDLHLKRNRIDAARLPRHYKSIAYDDTIELGKDFCRYSADEQILIMDLIDYGKLAERMSAFMQFILDHDQMARIAKKNARAVTKNLSLESYIQKLETTVQQAFRLKRERLSNGETPKMIRDNSGLLHYYQRKENRE
jgi:hypothetical protein